MPCNVLQFGDTIPLSYIGEVFPQLASRFDALLSTIVEKFRDGSFPPSSVSKLKCRKNPETELLSCFLRDSGVFVADMLARFGRSPQIRQNLEAYMMVAAIVRI